MASENALDVLSPAYEKLGPAMRALSERRRRFVLALCAQPGKPDQSKAVRAAGYQCSSPESFRVIGSQLIHDPKVCAAVREVAKSKLEIQSSQAVNALGDLLEDPEAAVRLRAANSVLDRAGIGTMTEQKISVEHVDDPGRDERMQHAFGVLAQRFGLSGLVQALPPPKAADVEDAEFREVEPAAAPEFLPW